MDNNKQIEKPNRKPKRKPVYFPTREAYERKVLAHAEKDPITKEERNFSKYIWRLVEEDMRRVESGGGHAVHPHPTHYDEPIVSKKKDAYILELMSGYL